MKAVKNASITGHISAALAAIDHGSLWTTTVVVATEFGRRHNNVMREVDALIKNDSIDVREIAHISYLDSMNRTQRAYRLTERAFLIAMPFIGGTKASLGQRRLVDSFLEMRAELNRRNSLQQNAYWQQTRKEGKGARLTLTDGITDFISYAKAQGSQNAEKYFMSITKMEYAALELVKQVSDQNFRDTLDAMQHTSLTVVEYACKEALCQGMAEGLHYKDIYKLAKASVEDLASSLKKHLPASQQRRLADPSYGAQQGGLL